MLTDPISRDSFQRFIFDELNIRGEWVRLSGSFEQATDEVDYPPAVKALLGQTIAASVLLTGTLKFAGSLSVHARGDGPVTLLMAEATNRRTFRGIANWQGDVQPGGSLTDLLGDAQLAITIDPITGSRYQGIVPLEHDSLEACLAHYFALSEQLDTYFMLVTKEDQCMGLMLQKLPGYDDVEDQDAWNRIVQLAKTLNVNEFRAHDNQTLLARLFQEERIISFDQEEVAFECSCSRERSLASIEQLGHEDALALLEQEQCIAVSCQFCSKSYQFDLNDMTELFKDS